MSEAIKDSCGCVFCDLGVPFAQINEITVDQHLVKAELIKCSRPMRFVPVGELLASGKVTSDNLRPVTKGEGQ